MKVGKVFNRNVGVPAVATTGHERVINSQTIYVEKYDNNNDVVEARGTVSITAAGSGYAKGCLYRKTDIATGLPALYINNGTRTSCDFVLVPAGEGYTQYAQVALTNAQMLALRATPITIIAAPGAGKIIEFVSAVLCFDRAGAYTETADNLAFKYTDGSGQAVSETIETTGFLTAAGDAVMPVKPITSAVILTAAGVNQAIVLHNTGDGELGGGNADNEVLVKVAYRVHSTGF